jgi:hypothetical protein
VNRTRAVRTSIRAITPVSFRLRNYSAKFRGLDRGTFDCQGAVYGDLNNGL